MVKWERMAEGVWGRNAHFVESKKWRDGGREQGKGDIIRRKIGEGQREGGRKGVVERGREEWGREEKKKEEKKKKEAKDKIYPANKGFTALDQLP